MEGSDLKQLLDQFEALIEEARVYDEADQPDRNLKLILDRLRAGEYELAKGKWQWDGDKLVFVHKIEIINELLERVFAIIEA